MARSDSSAPPAHRTTRHHRCDEAFLELLEEDFSLAQFALRAAFLGVVGEPKRSAIALCEWASRQDEPEKALLSWARKNRRGAFGISEEPVEDGWS